MSLSIFSLIQGRVTDYLSSVEKEQIREQILASIKGVGVVYGVSSLALGLGAGKLAVSSANSPLKTAALVLSFVGGALFLLADKVHMKASLVFACFTLGLFWGGRPAGKKIEDLTPDSLQGFSLANCNLTDEQLEKMVESGHFTHVRELDLSNNPELTGNGIACLTKLDKLEWLTLDGNPKVISEGLEKWATCGEGFKHLKSLSLARTQMDENLLQDLIAKASWWSYRLEGINLSYNPTLQKFPGTILTFQGLKEHGISSQDLKNRMLCFSGKGIWCIQDNLTLEPTKEIIDLAAAGKVVGVVKTRDDVKIPEFLSLITLPSRLASEDRIEAFYQICGLQV